MKFDYSYDIRFTYSAVETNLAIITASGPALRPLFMVWFPRFFSSLRGTSNQNYRYRGGAYALNDTGNANKASVQGNGSKADQLYGTSVSKPQILSISTSGVHVSREPVICH